jgi:hypothetical protein
MTGWTIDELNTVGTAAELEIQPRRADGNLRRPTTIWVVRDGEDLYVRSFRGPTGHWYQDARARHEGHIRCKGVDKDVRFAEEDDTAVNARIDAAYQTKYRRYGASYVGPMVAAAARTTTLKVLPH